MALIERHEGAARASIAHHYPGRDLNEVFAGGMTADECWQYLMHLPRDSPLMAAIYADPETVLSDEAAEMQLTEYSPEVEVSSDIYDVLIAILAHLTALTSKKPVKLSPRRRPGEARLRARKAQLREQARQEWAELCAQMGVPA